MEPLSPALRRALRARAHALHPVVSVSQNGLSEAVVREIDRSLTAHELIKIRIYGAEKAARQELLGAICERLGAAPVQHIGNVLVVFRENPQSPPESGEPGAPARGDEPRRRRTRSAAK